MSDMLGQNVEISNDIDSMGKVESNSRKLKFHDITYEKVNGAFKKRLAERNIKKEIKTEVDDYSVDKDQKHLDKVAVLMSQYKFVNSGVKESPTIIARRAIRLNEQMIFDAKLNSKLINAMLEKEKVDNVSTIDESDEEQLVNAINQINENEMANAEAPVTEEPVVPVVNNEEEVKEEPSVPVTEGFASETIDVDLSKVEPVKEEPLEVKNDDFGALFEEKVEPVEEKKENVILPMTDEEIEASRELLKQTEPRDDAHRFSFDDVFGPESKAEPVEEEKVVAPTAPANTDEEAFLEVDKLLQQADDLRSRGNRANEEREKAEQRRRAAEDRRQQASDDEAMKKAALAEAIEKYKAYVAELKENETETLKDIESANAAADEYEEATRAAEERSAYTQKVIDSLFKSMENKPKRR